MFLSPKLTFEVDKVTCSTGVEFDLTNNKEKIRCQTEQCGRCCLFQNVDNYVKHRYWNKPKGSDEEMNDN